MEIIEHGLNTEKGVVGRPGYGITVGGITYASLRKLAEAFSLNPRTVAMAHQKGQLDKLLKHGPYWYQPMHPITINGVHYASKNAAATAFRVTPSAISKAIRRGKLETAAAGWLAKREQIENGG